MLQRPREVAWEKLHRGTLPKLSSSFFDIKFGKVGLMSCEGGSLNYSQLEACRRVISRHLGRKGQIWVLVTPNYSLTSKPVGIRMGRGKGKVDSWYYRVKGGEVLIEVDGFPIEECRAALLAGAKKLPIATEIVLPEEPIEWF